MMFAFGTSCASCGKVVLFFLIKEISLYFRSGGCWIHGIFHCHFADYEKTGNLQSRGLSLSLANWQQPLANIDSPSTHSHFQGMCWFRIIEQHPPCGREPPARTMPYHLKSARAAEGGDGTDSG